MNKKTFYEELLMSWEELIHGIKDRIPLLANTTAVIHNSLKNHWTGFYLVKEDVLVLGPFQGPAACCYIPQGKGVCGTAWRFGRSIIVPDVHEFPDHIACSSLSNSELVIPIKNNRKEVVGVLDLDSEKLNAFDETDCYYLEQLVSKLGVIWNELQ